MVYNFMPGVLNPSPGVYIQDTEGYCFKKEDWNSNLGRTPNGIAVVSENVSFVVAFDYAYNYSCEWGTGNIPVAGATFAMDEDNAMADYNGAGNTDFIINAEHGTYAASQHCYNFVFPNGQNGYLGAAGEWAILVNNWAEYAACAETCGYTPLRSDRYRDYWTSTQYGNSSNSLQAWLINVEYGLSFYPKTSDAVVVAFTEL